MMKYLPRFVLGCSLFALMPVIAQAAGTYYNGNYYRSPQTTYSSQGYAQRTNNVNTAAYNRAGYASTRSTASVRNTGAATTQQAARTTMNNTANASAKNGFWLDAGFTHEMAQWQFEMKENASILHYDNIGWNVFDVKGGYEFDLGKLRGQIDAGFKYGMQSGESHMVDDDITKGGFLRTTWCQSVDSEGNCIGYIGDQIGHAMSIGKSDGGNMFGFNVGFGLTDAFKWGNVRLTPSVGYRYLKYKLETSQNYGLAVDTAKCIEVNGEIQCDPAIVVHYTNGSQQVIWGPTDENQDGFWDIAWGTDDDGNPVYADGLYPEGTYYFEQAGVSHSYEVEWAGPYVALDMDYMINANNAVNGRVELGFPGYTATGDQPYRFDWAHPKSVEDKAGMFGAFHLGFGANWMTAITNTLSLSVGLTYDYYSVSDADATTYLNGDYYMGIYNDLYNAYYAMFKENNPGMSDADLTTNTEQAMLNDQNAKYITTLEAECPGWVCKADSEIESFYKSIGIRVGLSARF